MKKTNNKTIIIIGASGHGKVLADIAMKNGYSNILFFDDDNTKKQCTGFPVKGKVEAAKNMIEDKIIAIGNPLLRKEIKEKIGKTVSLIHPNAIIGRMVKIGEGTAIMAGVVINSDTRIGSCCIINTSSSIDHDCKIGNYVHISVGAHVAGSCIIGDSTWIGAGATVSNNIEICDNCIIGAGAVVVKNITEPGVYVGIPARRIK